MAQPLNLGVALGASKTGQSVGYRLLNLDGTTQAAFTIANVVETTVAGTYVVTVPVNVSDNGARIIWGISGTDYAAFTIDPIANVNVYQVSGDSVAADNLEAAADGTGYNLGGGSIVAASVESLGTTAQAQVNTQADTALADYDAPTKAELDAAVAPLATSTALATVAGYIDTEVAAILSAVDTEIAAIKAKTDNLPASPANEATLTTVANNVSAILDDTGTSGVVLSASTLTAIADALLKRSVSNVENDASTHSLAEIILAMLESSALSTTWTIRKTDGSTFNTRTLTESAGALPVIGVT